MRNKEITITRTTLHQTSDNGYVEASMAERISMVWELTQSTWSFVPNTHVEPRLQRHVAVLARREG